MPCPARGRRDLCQGLQRRDRAGDTAAAARLGLLLRRGGRHIRQPDRGRGGVLPAEERAWTGGRQGRPATLEALGISGRRDKLRPQGGQESGELALLARLISAEGEGRALCRPGGRRAPSCSTGWSTRPSRTRYPRSSSSPAPSAACWTAVGRAVADSAYQAARDALAGADPSGGAIYYFNPVTATNAWIWSRPEIITIGKHRFCA